MSWKSVSQDDDTAQLLDAVVCYLRRFVMLTDVQMYAVALWVLHTHAFDAADTTPYLDIGSAEKQSGKTRLLEALEGLVARPWFTAGTSAAVLPRRIEAETPTLLLDESDAAFKGDKEYAQMVRGILNSDYRKGGKRTICTSNAKAIEYRDFKTFCPKAIAGLERLPDTVTDRSIRIEMRRRRQDEDVEKFRRRDALPQAQKLHEQLAAWASDDTISLLVEMRPIMPSGLGDRAQDVWEPLLAIADLAEGSWPDRGRSAAEALSSRQATDDGSLGVRLLTDIFTIFEMGNNSIASADLVSQLARIETSPWELDPHGRPCDQRRLARQLDRFKIRSRQLWLNDKNVRGYERSQFEDTFARYVPSPPPPQPTARPLEPFSDGRSSPGDPGVDRTSPPGVKPLRNGHSRGLADENSRLNADCLRTEMPGDSGTATRADPDSWPVRIHVPDIKDRIKEIGRQNAARLIETELD